MQDVVYFYHGAPRFQWFFESPNQCAAILGMGSMILLGALECIKPAQGWRKFYHPLGWLVIALCLAGLAFTYSRGGWIAFISGWIVFMVTVPATRKVFRSSGTVLLIFIFILTLTPNAAERIGGIGRLEDQSIANRILVWKGALQMIGEHWKSGVGEGNFGSVYSAWYQPEWMTTSYGSPLNDYLTVGAEHGVGILWCYLLSVTIPWACAASLVRLGKNSWMRGILAAQIVYLVFVLSGRSILRTPPWTFFLILYGIQAVFLMVYLWKNRGIICHFQKPVMIAGIGVTAACGLLMGLGLFLLNQLPTRQEEFSWGSEPCQMGTRVEPRQAHPRGVILYWRSQKDSPGLLEKKLLRPLAAEGYCVMTVDYSPRLKEGLEWTIKFMHWMESQGNFKKMPVVGMGEGMGGQLALLAATYGGLSIKGVIALNSPTEWPFAEYSLLQRLSQVKASLILLYEEGFRDDFQIEALRRQCEKLGKKCKIQRIENGGLRLPVVRTALWEMF